MADTYHEIDFSVPLSGSFLFDIHAVHVADELCIMFPDLHYEKTDKGIHMFGFMDDKTFEEWNKALQRHTVRLP